MSQENQENKACTRCSEDYPIESYHYANKAKGIRKSVCRDCSYLYSKEFIAKDPIAFKSYMRRYIKEHPSDYPGNHKSNKVPTVSGVYIINSLLTDDSYIGASSNLRNRRYKHSRNVGKSKQHKLSKLIDEYGWQAFEFRVLEECAKEDIFTLETQYINKLKPNLNIQKNK